MTERQNGAMDWALWIAACVPLLALLTGCQYGKNVRPVPPVGDASLGMYARMIQGDHFFSDLGARGVERVMVTKVLPNGPADRAGIRPGAILQKINGHHCRNAESLIRLVRNLTPGEHVDVSFYQDGKTHQSRLLVGRSSDLWNRPAPNSFEEVPPPAEIMQGF